MKILHYSLGFPPYRTGGMTKYCIDLMKTQIEDGHDVSLLWPGEILPWKKTEILRRKSYMGIGSYEIVNPMPVPLDEGINNPESFTKQGNIEVFTKLLNNLSPDVVHIHTLMGLHKEFVIAAQNCRIKTVFTSHDYFGLCPKVTLFRNGEACDNDNNCKKCVECNLSGLSETKIAVLQSAAYRYAKNSSIVKMIRKKHRAAFFDDNQGINNAGISDDVIEKKSKEYIALRKYYMSIFSEIDIMHFNSSVAMEVYSRYLEPNNYIVYPVTHMNIRDNRKKKDFTGEKLRITYLGPAKSFKGFNLLKTSLDRLWEESSNFELRIFNVIEPASPYMIMKDGYLYEELGDIFDNTDVLVAPSLWYETFGFTVLEALSYGVPVVISSKVGAKDIVGDKFGITIKSEETEDLYNALKEITNHREILKEINRRIVDTLVLPRLDYYTEIYNVND